VVACLEASIKDPAGLPPLCGNQSRSGMHQAVSMKGDMPTAAPGCLVFDFQESRHQRCGGNDMLPV
jgi:hypothetical protein